MCLFELVWNLTWTLVQYKKMNSGLFESKFLCSLEGEPKVWTKGSKWHKCPVLPVFGEKKEKKNVPQQETKKKHRLQKML